MPELPFAIVWPDGTHMRCRSPSTILRKHLPSGSYLLLDFEDAVRAGLHAASERVREVHGHPCSQAHAQLHAIEAASRRFHGDPDAHVTVELA